MKKLFSFVLSAMMIILASCTQDDLSNLPLGQEMNTKVSMQLPTMQRAGYDDPAVSGMRVFLIVSHEDEVVDVQTATATSNTVNFDVRLVTGQSYDLAAWADFGSTYYTVDAAVGAVAPSVSIVMAVDGDNNKTITGSDNKRDAYFAISNGVVLRNNEPISMTLKRPFGLVKIVTNDFDQDAVVNAGLLPDSYTTTIEMPTDLSLVDGVASNDQVVTIAASTADVAASGELSFDYIFASTNKELISFSMDYKKGTADLLSYDFKDIPLQRNYKTNISGNILTKQGSVTVTIDQEWEGNFYNGVQNAAQLKAILDAIPADNNQEVVITLAENFVIEDGLIIDKPYVTILGPNAGVNPNASGASVTFSDASQDGETTLEVGYIKGLVQVAANHVKFDGVTFKGASIINGSWTSYIDNLTIINCTFSENAHPSYFSYIYINGSADRSDNILIENNRFDVITNAANNASSVIVWKADNVVVRGNHMLGSDYHGVQFNSNNNILVENNNINGAPYCGIQVADYAEGNVIIKNNTLTDCNTIYYTNNALDYYGAIRVYSSKDGIKDINLEIEGNTITASQAHRAIYLYNRVKVAENVYVDNTPAAWNDVISNNTISGYAIAQEIGSSDKIAASNGESYATISDAIAGVPSEATIYLAGNTTFEEIIVNANKTLTIIGQEGTKVQAAYLNGGSTTFENVEFYGAGMSAGSYSTVFAGGTATLNLVNCVVNVTEVGGAQARPIETAYNAAVKITIDGCTITANSAKNTYLNPVAEGGSLTVKNSTFVGKGLTAEFNCDPNSAKVRPVIENNNFGYTSVGFSYYANPVITDASGLDSDTKALCNAILTNNTFAATNKIKVTPLPSGTYFWVNEPIE